MHSDTILAFTDFETTGLDTNTDYPIEIGIIFTDYQFNIIQTYENMILWPQLSGLKDWPSWALNAYAVHKIKYEDYINQSVPFNTVRTGISNICSIIKKERRNPIIVSDCSNFEMGFMQNLFEKFEDKFPFHYCTWDTSLFLETVGVGDPRNVPHRAMGDIKLVYDAVLKSYNIIKGCIINDH